MANNHTISPTPVRGVGGRKASATSSRRGSRDRILPNVREVRFETSNLSDRMSAQTFLVKADAALVDTFQLIGVRFEKFLKKEAFEQKDLGLLVKELKTFVSGFIPFVLNDELPVGFNIFIALKKIDRRASDWLRQRLFAKRNLNRKLRIASMINYSKRLFPSLPRTIVDEKVSDFQNFVCSPDNDILHDRHAIEERITLEVKQMPRFHADYSTPFVPSQASCVERSKSGGGLASLLIDLLKPISKDHPWFKHIDLLETLGEEQLFVSMLPIWEELMLGLMDLAFITFPLVGPWVPSFVEPKGLGEPLKVRVITKSCWVNQLLKPIQQAWHGTMRKIPTYELIGGVKVTDAIRDLRLAPGQKFVSGDYEAATDRIHLHYTAYACEAMLNHTDFTFPAILEGQYGSEILTHWFRRYCHHSFECIYMSNEPFRSLPQEDGSSLPIPQDDFLSWNAWSKARSTLENRPEFVYETDFFSHMTVPGTLQDLARSVVKEIERESADLVTFMKLERGQMMGHILSFPLLCLINKAASSMSLPPDRFIRINGDDVLFPATPSEYKEWEMNTKHVGLKKSIGKNYYSRDMAMINSEVYTWSKEENRLVRLVFPNVGLLGYLNDFVDETGRQVTPWEQLSGILTDFWSGVPEENQKYAKALIRARYPIIGGFPGSWFGPTALGNLGLPVPPGHEYTRYQRIWMEAHRTGVYSFREGLLTDYSRIETLYQEEITQQDPFLSWGVPGGPMPPEDIVPDPYSRSGGMARELMQIKRWFTKIPVQKKFRVFGHRRFNRFLKKNPTPPLSGTALESVLTNCWSEERPRWFHKRRGIQPDLAQPFELPF